MYSLNVEIFFLSSDIHAAVCFNTIVLDVGALGFDVNITDIRK